MPCYNLTCDTCGWKGEVFHRMNQGHPACPECGKDTRVDWIGQKPPAAPDIRPWIGLEGRSFAFGIDPELIPRAKELYPSMEYDPKTGDAIFHNDKHHRKCMKEINAVSERARQIELERQEKNDDAER